MTTILCRPSAPEMLITIRRAPPCDGSRGTAAGQKSHPSRAGSIVAPTAAGDKAGASRSSARAAASLRRQEPVVLREDDRLRARLDAELLEDPRDVIADGLLAD